MLLMINLVVHDDQYTMFPMPKTLTQTNFQLPGQTHFYQGKVRDVYTINDSQVVMIATDRISAFDVVLARGIPYKGQVLNQLAIQALETTKDIVPNWLTSSPHPNVSIGQRAKPFLVEVVVRGYLTGHAWREYKAGKRQLCGIALAEGLKENDPLPEGPIITPSTKAHEGHDQDISREEIIAQGIVSETDYTTIEGYALKLFARGQEVARQRGLILVDTKYEFGKTDGGEIMLIDEAHTPDSSRFFYSEGYEQRQDRGEPQRQLSKEFVREWLIEHNFSGQAGQNIPELPDDFIQATSERYIELFSKLSSAPLAPAEPKDKEILDAILAELTPR